MSNNSLPERTGRKPILVKFDHVREKVLDAIINDGAPIGMAAKRAGISRKTIFNWMAKGREAREAKATGNGPLTHWDDHYIEFLEKIENAEYDIMLKHLNRIDEAGEANWTASAWMLERMFPEEFSLKRTVRHEGTDGGPVEFTVNIGDEPEEKNTEKPEAIEADYEVVED